MRRFIPAVLLFSFFFIALPDAGRAETITGRVVALADGDTLTVLTDRKDQIKVRLAEIDTPESGQPFGTRARQMLSDLVFGKQVRVVVQDTDRYGRIVGRVFAGTEDINARMVRDGSAWVYRRYSRDSSLLPLEQDARRSRRGLWALAEAERTPPWEWRAARRDGSDPTVPHRQTATRQTRTAAGYACAPAKRSCGAMASCAEAEFYLGQCGVTGLDRNGDGVPCENLCR